jgi:hypothetical protein
VAHSLFNESIERKQGTTNITQQTNEECETLQVKSESGSEARLCTNQSSRQCHLDQAVIFPIWSFRNICRRIPTLGDIRLSCRFEHLAEVKT